MKLLYMIVAVLMLSTPAVAQDKEIKGVISDQINSFLRDDFETAFSFAAPNIKRIFQTSERFGRMVVRSYPMVHRPSEFQFQRLRNEAGTLTQEVVIRDANGDYYNAEYQMVLVEGTWQISGVQIVKAPGVGV